MTDVDRHCAELNRCNQRGGRMLSIFDLLEAETLDLDLAAHLAARIACGASFLVGARPGGAGKTTVMCALLNLAPREMQIVAAEPRAVRKALRAPAPPPRCFLCHEIGAGPYYAYLWDSDLRAYCSLAESGHMLATNLHADTLDEACSQVCEENQVPVAHFRAIRLQIFLRVNGRARRVDTVFESDGLGPHAMIYSPRGGLRPPSATPEEPNDGVFRSHCRLFLEDGLARGLRTIEQTRRAFLEFPAREGE